jgi:hypothetical protein
MGSTPATVGAVDGGRVDPDEDLVVLGDRLLDLLQALDLRGPIPIVDHRSHRRTSFLAWHGIGTTAGAWMTPA